MKVTLVDQSVEALKKGLTGIETNLGKIAKKKFADDPEVIFVLADNSFVSR